MLLQAGADPNARDALGETVLHKVRRAVREPSGVHYAQETHAPSPSAWHFISIVLPCRPLVAKGVSKGGSNTTLCPPPA